MERGRRGAQIAAARPVLLKATRRSAPAGAARMAWEAAFSAALQLATLFGWPVTRCHCVVPEQR
eukprot:708718-Lingulodinium_polyedra.AAC.1